MFYYVDIDKKLGGWVNEGTCEADTNTDSSVDLRMSRQFTDTEKSCGPGTQRQTRTCTDGTTDKCTKADTEQIISCKEAGTPLPECPGKILFRNLRQLSISQGVISF